MVDVEGTVANLVQPQVIEYKTFTLTMLRLEPELVH